MTTVTIEVTDCRITGQYEGNPDAIPQVTHPNATQRTTDPAQAWEATTPRRWSWRLLQRRCLSGDGSAEGAPPTAWRLVVPAMS